MFICRHSFIFNTMGVSVRWCDFVARP